MTPALLPSNRNSSTMTYAQVTVISNITIGAINISIAIAQLALGILNYRASRGNLASLQLYMCFEYFS